MNKMVYGQNGIGQNGTDKMVRTKWYGQIKFQRVYSTGTISPKIQNLLMTINLIQINTINLIQINTIFPHLSQLCVTL
jgi:hypothetical protein